MNFLFCWLLFGTVITFSDQIHELSYKVQENSIKKLDYSYTMNLNLLHEPDNSLGEIKNCTLSFISLDKNILHLLIEDVNSNRWTVPLEYNSKRFAKFKQEKIENTGLEFSNNPFNFEIVDKNTDISILNPNKSMKSLKFYDKYLEIAFTYPTQQMFGLGERVSSYFDLCHNKTNCTYTVFNRAAFAVKDDDKGGKNLYGAHPFMMFHYQTEKTSIFYATLIYTTNAQDVNILKINNEKTIVTHKIVGGIFDIYFFYAGTAEFILQKYHTLIGYPYLPPFWSLGFHQSRWGWSNLYTMDRVQAKFDLNDIPLEVLWSDIDYMDDFANFSIHPKHFKYIKDFIDVLHTKSIKWIPIIDAGIKLDPKCKYYSLGESNGAFIKSAYTQKTLVANVWPGKTVFADWYHPFIETLYQKGYSDLFDKAEYDGIWLDMNEPQSFCSGECPNDIYSNTLNSLFLSDFIHDPHEFDKLPYLPGNASLNTSTISMSGYHFSQNSVEDAQRKEFNVHSLFAYQEAKITHKLVTNIIRKRPFFLTRSGFIGSQQYTSKWTGDNFSTWDYMQLSIAGIYNQQLMGFAHSGADICGFLGNTTEELCARWMQIGAFYPFSRNHNCQEMIDQEPYALGDRVISASRNAIRQKYSLLRYYYSKMFDLSINGGTLFRPIFFEFPLDYLAQKYSDFSFMIGEAILVVPVLNSSTNTVTAYFPRANWYHLQNLTQIIGPSEIKRELEIFGGFEYVNVFLRGGRILLYQDAIANKVKRTNELKKIPLEIIIAPDETGNAYGKYYFDNEDAINPVDSKEFVKYEFEYEKKNKVMNVNLEGNWTFEYECEQLFKIVVLNTENTGNACTELRNGELELLEGEYNATKRTMTFLYKSYRITSWRKIKRVIFENIC